MKIHKTKVEISVTKVEKVRLGSAMASASGIEAHSTVTILTIPPCLATAFSMFSPQSALLAASCCVLDAAPLSQRLWTPSTCLSYDLPVDINDLRAIRHEDIFSRNAMIVMIPRWEVF